MKISTKQQEYIEVIYELSRKDDHGHAHAKAIAERLHNKMGSVTEAVKNLADLGLINYTARQAITLTDAGKKIADELHRRHEILAHFLEGILGTSPERAQQFACEIEHLIDEPLTRRFANFVDFMNAENPKLIQAFKEKNPPIN